MGNDKSRNQSQQTSWNHTINVDLQKEPSLFTAVRSCLATPCRISSNTSWGLLPPDATPGPAGTAGPGPEPPGPGPGPPGPGPEPPGPGPGPPGPGPGPPCPGPMGLTRPTGRGPGPNPLGGSPLVAQGPQPAGRMMGRTGAKPGAMAPGKGGNLAPGPNITSSCRMARNHSGEHRGKSMHYLFAHTHTHMLGD